MTLDDLAGYDLVVAADGTGSKIREQSAAIMAATSASTVETATAKFIWFGTDYLFDGLTFVHERGPDGVFAVHGYPISAERLDVHRRDRRGVLARGPASTSSTSPSRPEPATW